MKEKVLVTRNANELADMLGLHPSAAMEWEMRSKISNRIIDSFKKENLSVSEVARIAGTSRARVTKILKSNSIGISIDVLIRVLWAVGDEVKLNFKKVG